MGYNKSENQEIHDEIEKKPLEIPYSSIGEIDEIRKWSKFFSILGFIFIGLIIIVGLFFGSFFSILSGGIYPLPFPGFLMTFMYLALAVIYFFPVLYLFRFSNLAGKAIKTNDSEKIGKAFTNLRSHYRFIGIFTIIILGVYLIVAIIAFTIGGILSSGVF